jgi:Predicted membrane protein (DUF2339)
MESLDTSTPEFSSNHRGERASDGEMRFAGHYLNLAGILLLLTGLVSYLKSAAPSGGSTLPAGILESLLGAGLGLVLLIAGEYLYRKGLQQFSHPLLTAGFCLLFFVACSAHFRHQLLDESSLFILLLAFVVASNASVFRYDSKLIGNVMSVVYFATPLLLAFDFGNFTALFLYLFAINLGTALVALRKKWDFQLVVASLGSYSLYFLHFRGESAGQALALLVLIYTLSFVANNVIFFTRPENSNFNLLVSFVNPCAFAAFSSMVVLGFSNWVPVSVYLGLALGHAGIAKIADSRSGENNNFKELATNNLLLSLLFLCAGISFVTYFSNTTSYFTLVTVLWFTLAVTLLWAGFVVFRHRNLLSRFSLFALALATFQVTYVLPSMGLVGLGWAACLIPYLAYSTLMFAHRKQLTTEQVWFLKGCVMFAVLAVAKISTNLIPVAFHPVVLLMLGAGSLTLAVENNKLGFVRPVGHLLLAAGLWTSLQPWDLTELAWISLPLGSLLVGYGAYRTVQKGCTSQEYWFWFGALIMRMGFLPVSHSAWLMVLALALVHLSLTWIGGVAQQEKLYAGMSGLIGVVLIGTLLLGADLPIGVLLAACVITGLSVLAARQSQQKADLLLGAPALVFGLRILLEVYLPYPTICLFVLASVACLLMRASHMKVSLMIQGLVGVGLLFLPLSSFASPWQGAGLAGILGAFLLTYRWALVAENPGCAIQAMEGIGALVLFRFSLLFVSSPVSTLCWALLACGLLRHTKGVRNWNLLGQGTFDLSRLLFFAAFIKSIVYDANIVDQLSPVHFPSSALVAGVFLVTAHQLVRKTEARNALVISGLLILCFQVTFLLHRQWGDYLVFQPILSGFWCITAFLIVAAGIALKVRVYRMFGLTTLVASVSKILLVDIHVLDSYSQTNTYLILGTLLVTTSLLYQKQRERLCGDVRTLRGTSLADTLPGLG